MKLLKPEVNLEFVMKQLQETCSKLKVTTLLHSTGNSIYKEQFNVSPRARWKD